jgi:hypothetical protein
MSNVFHLAVADQHISLVGWGVLNFQIRVESELLSPPFFDPGQQQTI